jgi:hypothetical protein
MEWQDIKTAPRDGTEILAYSATGHTDVMLVRYIAMIDFLTEAEIEKYVDVRRRLCFRRPVVVGLLSHPLDASP